MCKSVRTRGSWENSRQLCKPERQSRVCITVENSPNPPSYYTFAQFFLKRCDQVTSLTSLVTRVQLARPKFLLINQTPAKTCGYAMGEGFLKWGKVFWSTTLQTLYIFKQKVKIRGKISVIWTSSIFQKDHRFISFRLYIVSFLKNFE